MNNKTKFEKINNAVIELGSNSIRLLIFRRNKQGKLFQVNRTLRYTQLNQDLSKTGVISEAAIKRNLNALGEYQKLCQDYDVHHVYLFGTSAMREAKNAAEVAQVIKNQYGLDVHIISGETEAKYGFYGVSQSFKEPILIFDIGGGSTELISGDNEIENEASLPLGCVRSSEMFIKDQNHITEKEIQDLSDYSFDLINGSLEKFNLEKNYKLVGIGGTITTISSIIQELPIYDSDKIHKSVVNYEQLRSCLDRFVSTDINGRKNIIGLPEKRVNNIAAGTVIALSTLKAAKRTRCTVCDFDSLEGAAYLKFMLENPKSWDNQKY